MSMVIGTNISSLTAQRHLATSRADLNQSMERLSSGQRINSAQDDAAGLAISDKMDSQVNGLTQAVRNANDAISLGQTAEGTLEETTAILQRMRDLSVQSGNATNTASDRTAMQNEVTTLQAELTRISSTSSFNGTALLDGTFTAASFQIGHNASDTVSLSISAMGAADLNKVTAVTGVTARNAVTAVTGVAAVTAVAATAGTSTLTFTTVAKANDVTEVTIGSASLAHTFATAPADVTAAATAYTTAWNDSTDADVAAFTASSSLGVVTFTQDTASDGVVSSSVANSSAGAAVRSTIAAGVDAVVAVTEVLGTGTVTITTDAAAVDVLATVTMTIQGGAIKATDTMTMTAGSATLAHEFAADAASLTAAADAYVAAWNASTDAEVLLYTASNIAGAITITEDSATAGDLAFAGSVAQVGAGSNIAVATAAAAGVTGVLGNELQVTIGDAVFTYTAQTGDDANVTAVATSFVAAWNADNDADVSKITASRIAGVITFTEDVGTAGALTPVSVESGIVAADAAATVGVAKVDKVASTAIQTFTVAAGANEVIEINVGGASMVYDFGSTAMASVTATADAVVAAWNASTDSDVKDFTATNSAGVVTYTKDSITAAGALSVAVVNGANAGVQSNTATAGTTGVAQVTAVTAVTAVTGVTARAAVTAVTGSSVNTLDISTTAGATAAITSLDLAIAEVSAERATLGAFQNRLEHTVSNLSSMIENTAAARSRIQDADFAIESANLAKNQVMQQAGTAMLAQANASSQGVLSLLK